MKELELTFNRYLSSDPEILEYEVRGLPYFVDFTFTEIGVLYTVYFIAKELLNGATNFLPDAKRLAIKEILKHLEGEIK